MQSPKRSAVSFGHTNGIFFFGNSGGGGGQAEHQGLDLGEADFRLWKSPSSSFEALFSPFYLQATAAAEEARQKADAARQKAAAAMQVPSNVPSNVPIE